MRIKNNWFTLLAVILSTASINLLFGQTVEWVKHMGSIGWDQATSIITDGQNNIYFTGTFEDTVDFNPGMGVAELQTLSIKDAFVCKLNASGDYVWAGQIGGGFIESHAIALDSSGNIYLCGSFLGQLDFDPGPNNFYMTSTGFDRDIFVLKLDNSGNFLWAKQISGYTPFMTSLPAPTDAHAMAVDKSGTIVLTGYFDGTVDFDPDSTSTHHLTVQGATNIFVCKLSTNGNLIWAKQFTGSMGALGYAIGLDRYGNVYSTGTMADTVDFDPGPNDYKLFSTDPSYTAVYLSKLDSSGNFAWAKTMGFGSGYSMAVEEDGTSYSSGWFNNGSVPAISKIDASGNILWSKELGGIDGKSITLDHYGNVYTTGSCFTGTHDFDPGPNVFNLSGDEFLLKLDTAGNFLWAGALSSNGQVFTNAIVAGNNAVLYTAGFFVGDTDFDYDSTSFNFTTPVGDNYHIYVEKLKPVFLNTPEIMEKIDVRIYPNPASDVVFIDLNSVDVPVKEIKLMETSGKTVYLQSEITRKGIIEIPLPTISHGTYLLMVTGINGSSITKRLVID